MDDLFAYSEEQYCAIFEDLIEDLTYSMNPTKNPQAYILGGQSGAGKSTLHKLILEEMQGNIIIVDNDTFKPLHPNYDQLAEKIGVEVTEYVKPFSNRLTNELIDYLSDQKYNLIIEGTLRTTETPIKTNTQLKNKGYSTNLYVIATQSELSYLSTLERYLDMYLEEPETARATPKVIHDEIVKAIPGNLETLYNHHIFNEIKVLTRQGELLYSMHATPLKSPKSVLEEKLTCVLNIDQRENIYGRLEQKLQRIKEKAVIENKILVEIETRVASYKNLRRDKIKPKQTILQKEIEQAKMEQEKLLKHRLPSTNKEKTKTKRL